MPRKEGSVVDTTGARGVFSTGTLATLYKGHYWTTAGWVANAVGARGYYLILRCRRFPYCRWFRKGDGRPRQL